MAETKTEDLITNDVKTYVEKVIKELEITNHTIDISAGSIRGDNYLGIIAKVVVTGKDKLGKQTTLNLIVKSAPRNESYRSLAPIQQAYNRENYMYSKVFPEFMQFQEERGVLKPFKSIAKFYKSTMDHLNEAIIMENMKEMGYELRDRREPLDYNHVLFVMKEYGKFHALSFALRDQKPELFRELLDNTQEVFFNDDQTTESMKKEIKEYCARAIAALDPIKDKVVYDKMQAFQEDVLEKVRAAVNEKSAENCAVIGHGDCWINNMLFKYGNTSKPRLPSDICFIDWQLARAGSPALDLAYFIFASTDKELRDEHYEHLIQEYYDSFSNFLREVGSDPDKLFPFETLQRHLKKFCVYGLYMASVILYLITSEVDDIPDIHDIKEGEDAMEKFSFESRNIEKYNVRIKDVMLDFVKYNYDF